MENKLRESQERVEKRIGTLEKLCKRNNLDVTAVLDNYYAEVKSYEPYYLTREQRENIVKDFVADDDIKYEITECLYKLYELERIANNWKIKYEKEQNKLNMEKITVIWNFLTDWENKSIEWYKENAKKYFELVVKEDSKFEEYKKSEQYERDLEYFKKWHKYSPKLYLEQSWKQAYYKYIDNFTKQIVSFIREYDGYKTIKTSYKVNEEVLNKAVAKEKLDKYLDLINRVTKLVGEIRDAKYLSVSPQGELNGIIIGTYGKVRIETISAGGYNIQRFHYRVLLKKS